MEATAKKPRTRTARKPVAKTIILKPEPRAQSNNVVEMPDNLTSEERAIFSRVAASTDDWRTITEEDSEDFSLSEDPFKLPLPAIKLRDGKKFAFRWITRTSQRIDEMKNKNVPFRWWPVNSTQPVAGAFDSFLDSCNGCISRYDQMLVFKPWWMFQKELEYKRQLAEGNAPDLTMKDKTPVGDLEYRAGKRKVTEKKSLREEVKGSDVQYEGEAEMDRAAGIYTPQVMDSDLVAEE